MNIQYIFAPKSSNCMTLDYSNLHTFPRENDYKYKVCVTTELMCWTTESEGSLQRKTNTRKTNYSMINGLLSFLQSMLDVRRESAALFVYVGDNGIQLLQLSRIP